MNPIWYLVIAGVILELGFWYYLERLRHELK